VSHPLVYLDLESTGLDIETARIVEIALLRDDGDTLVSVVHPGRPIPPEATAVHGVADGDVEMAPRFAEIAATVQVFLDGAVLVGYGSRRFDVPLLDAELRRAGQLGIDLDTSREIDLYEVWRALEPRTLVGAMTHYLGIVLAGAHGALADADAVRDLMPAMMAQHAATVEQLMALSRPATATRRGRCDRWVRTRRATNDE